MRLVAYFIRHGETDLNKANCFRGPLDADLNDEGCQQAQEAADYLKDARFSAAFTSPKIRAKQTALTVMKGHNAPLNVVPNLDSYNIGDLAGKPKNEENLKIIRYHQEHPDKVIPGGEALNTFRKDVDPNIAGAIRLGDQAGIPTASFVHSSTVHEVSHILHGDHQKVKVRPGGVVGVFKTNNGAYVARALFKESVGNKDRDIGS